MSEKFPGFFTAIFGGRKAKEPEPVEPKKKAKKKIEEKPEPPQELPKQTLSQDYLRHVQIDEGNEIRKEILKSKEGDEVENGEG